MNCRLTRTPLERKLGVNNPPEPKVMAEPWATKAGGANTSPRQRPAGFPILGLLPSQWAQLFLLLTISIALLVALLSTK